MYYVGNDLHKETIWFYIVDENGKKVYVFTSLRTELRVLLWLNALWISAIVPCHRTNEEYALAPRLTKSCTAGRGLAKRAQHPYNNKYLFMMI
ncbi:MAG: hypothetical protein ACUZ8I_16490 [Candidatus Scalindua sp.]